MKFFLNLGVGKRLGVGFALLLIFILLVGVIGIGGMNKLYNKVNNIVLFNNAKITFAEIMSASISQRENGILSLLLAADDAQKQEIIEKIKWQVTQYDEAKNDLAEVLATSAASESETQIVAKIQAGESTVAPLLTKAMDLSLANKNGDALKILNEEVGPELRNWAVDVRELVSIEQRLNEAAAVETEQSYTNAKNLALVCAALAILLGVAIAFLITRSITRPLSEALGLAQRVAVGDLTSTVEVKTKDETGKLLQALKDMNESLSGIVGDVRDTTDSIATASKQIAVGNSDLSQRTEEQASSLEETASSMEELTSTVRQNAENAKQANQLAASASDIAVKGGQVVGQVVETMTSISDSSKKIVDIISVIEGIAFQTNILALNAAVEAARAGEQGRGFAVVAGEVRNLAQRSAAAAKEIKTLIGDSVDKVGTGAKLVDQAGATMSEIVSAVKRVTDIMSEISAASTEQSAGIEQVNQAITQMDEVTQQNAALVEEAAAAAESMQEQANSLMEAVSVFKLEAVTGRQIGTAATKPVHTMAASAHSAPRRAVSSAAGAPVKRIPKLDKAAYGTEEWKEF